MSGVTYTWAVPDDVDLDSFSSGDTEVDDYFRSRRWFKGKSSPGTYQFRSMTGEVLGYATAAFRSCPHPDDQSGATALYLVIYALGVHGRFHGRTNHASHGETFAESIMDELVRLASTRRDCVGVALWVRETNARAIAFYRKVGFVPDPGGSIQRDGAARHLTMRLRQGGAP